MIPLKIEVEIFGYMMRTWRWFILVLSLTLLIGAGFLLRFPESPKFLLTKGEKKQTLLILRLMYAINNNKLPEDYPVIHLIY